MMRRKKRAFTAEFKAEAAKLVVDGGRTCSEVAKSHDLAPSLVAGWVRRARREDRPSGRDGPVDGNQSDREKLLKLEREHKELQRENEFLKKTARWFAAQKQ